MLSERLVHVIRLHPERQWRLAQSAGLHPSTLSRWLNRVESPKPDDPRLGALADLVGVPREECVDENTTTVEAPRPLEGAGSRGMRAASGVLT